MAFKDYVPSFEFKVLDKNDDWVGYFEKVISVQWLEKWTEPGEFKMEMELTEHNAKLYDEAYSVLSSDSETRMVICHSEGVQDDEPVGTLSIRGFSWLGWLSRRIIRGGTYMLTNVEAAIYLIALMGTGDVITNDTPQGLPATTSKQVSYGDMMTTIKELCDVSGYGVICRHNYPSVSGVPIPKPLTDTLTVEKGIDRTSANLPFFIGVLSDANGTLRSVQVSAGWEDYRNLAQVAGQDEGVDRRVIDVWFDVGGERPQGRDLLEMHVDARDLQQTYIDDNGNEQTMTDAEYDELLRQRGLEKLQETISTVEIVAVPNSNTLQYGKDFNMGDWIEVQLTQFNMVRMKARVEEVNHVHEAEQQDVLLTLSNFEVLATDWALG